MITSCSTSRASRPSRSSSGGPSTRRSRTWSACSGRTATPPSPASSRRSRTGRATSTGSSPGPSPGRRWTSAAFLRSYLEIAEPAGLVPTDREQLGLLLRCYTLDKSLYELQYELNNRPKWVRIPLAAIALLAERAAKTPRGRPPVRPHRLDDHEVARFLDGRSVDAFEGLGAFPGAGPSAFVCTWAPNARAVSVVGDFNDWAVGISPLHRRGSTGLWEAEVRGLTRGDRYQFAIVPPAGGPPPAEGRPLRPPRRAGPRPRVGRLGPPRPPLDRRATGWPAGRGRGRSTSRSRSTRSTSAPGSRPAPTAAGPPVRRSPRSWCRLRRRDRLHPRRADAPGRAPVHGLLGLSGHRLLRPDRPLRDARRT